MILHFRVLFKKFKNFRYVRFMVHKNKQSAAPVLIMLP